MTRSRLTSDDTRGKAFEKDLQKAMDEVRATAQMFYLRLYDTTSAQAKAFLPPQPADYVLAFPGGSALLEAKASLVHFSFADDPRKILEPHQGAAARLFKRAGGDPYVVFRSEGLNSVELWDGEQAALMAVGGIKKSTNPQPLDTYLDTAESLRLLITFIVKRRRREQAAP